MTDNCSTELSCIHLKITKKMRITLSVLNNNSVHMQLLNFQTYPSPWQFRQRDHLKLKKQYKNYLKFVGKLFSFLLKFHLPFSVAVPASNAKNNQIFYLLETFILYRLVYTHPPVPRHLWHDFVEAVLGTCQCAKERKNFCQWLLIRSVIDRV